MSMERERGTKRICTGLGLALLAGCASAPPTKSYDQYVWPPPPDKARIQLEDVVLGRVDVQAKTSGLQRKLLGAGPQNPFDWLKKPFAVAYDREGRLLVTDPALSALFRFDRAHRKADVFGTTGAVTLKQPLGLGVGPDGTAYVADAGLKKVVAIGSDGKLVAVFGREGELENPTDAELSPDGARLFVADSKGHRIVVFERASGKRLTAFGQRGEGEGEFNFPTSLAFDADANLLVVDQLNARIQVFSQDGHFVEKFGALGVGFSNFVRPKDVAVDELGYSYVTDAAFGNVQIFDADRRLLTYVGANGEQPGQFRIASGVAVRGERIAVVDQLGHRVQVFRFVVPKDAP